jgi:hypothetical protein
VIPELRSPLENDRLRAFMCVLEAAAFIMTRKMLRGLKRRSRDLLKAVTDGSRA